MPEDEAALHPADTMKSLDQVLSVDPRNQHIDLADWHAAIQEINLVDSAPKEVKQLFENAKNVSLYTFFAYRLHQSAQLIGYSALEKALKLKFAQEKNNINIERPPSRLVDYMNIALEQKWITSQGYESSRHIAEARVQHKKLYELIDSGALANGKRIPIPQPEEHEVLEEMEDMGIAQTRLHASRHIRNFLAHGEGGLHPSSIQTLRLVAEEINQLFKD